MRVARPPIWGRALAAIGLTATESCTRVHDVTTKREKASQRCAEPQAGGSRGRHGQNTAIGWRLRAPLAEHRISSESSRAFAEERRTRNTVYGLGRFRAGRFLFRARAPGQPIRANHRRGSSPAARSRVRGKYVKPRAARGTYLHHAPSGGVRAVMFNASRQHRRKLFTGPSR